MSFSNVPHLFFVTLFFQWRNCIMASSVVKALQQQHLRQRRLQGKDATAKVPRPVEETPPFSLMLFSNITKSSEGFVFGVFNYCNVFSLTDFRERGRGRERERETSTCCSIYLRIH